MTQGKAPMKNLYNALIESLRIPQFVKWLNERPVVQRLGNSRTVNALGWPTRKVEAAIRSTDPLSDALASGVLVLRSSLCQAQVHGGLWAWPCIDPKGHDGPHSWERDGDACVCHPDKLERKT